MIGSKLSSADIEDIKARRERGETLRAIAKHYEIDHTYVSKLSRGLQTIRYPLDQPFVSERTPRGRKTNPRPKGVWRPLPGREGYEVSRDGRVWSTRQGGQLIRPSRTQPTTMAIRARDGVKATTTTLPRVVLLAWVGPPRRGHGRAMRRDGDILNNHVSNLYWAGDEDAAREDEARMAAIAEQMAKKEAELERMRAEHTALMDKWRACNGDGREMPAS